MRLIKNKRFTFEDYEPVERVFITMFLYAQSIASCAAAMPVKDRKAFLDECEKAREIFTRGMIDCCDAHNSGMFDKLKKAAFNL